MLDQVIDGMRVARGGEVVVVLEQADPFVSRPVDRVEAEQRLADAGVDRHIITATKLEQLERHPGPEVDIAIDGGDAFDLDLGRAEEKAEGDDVVDIGADIGIENDAVRGGHGCFSSSGLRDSLRCPRTQRGNSGPQPNSANGGSAGGHRALSHDDGGGDASLSPPIP
jgi:hypothetical protein